MKLFWSCRSVSFSSYSFSRIKSVTSRVWVWLFLHFICLHTCAYTSFTPLHLDKQIMIWCNHWFCRSYRLFWCVTFKLGKLKSFWRTTDFRELASDLLFLFGIKESNDTKYVSTQYLVEKREKAKSFHQKFL